MDTSLPNRLLLPSKAKQQRAQAQDWAHVETWLSNKYRGRSIPPFERNEATLSALLALAAANERADEEAELLRRVQEEALKELEETEIADSDAEILRALTTNLTPEGAQSLEALAGLTVALDASSPDPEALAHTLINIHTTSHRLSQHLTDLSTTTSYLSAEHANLLAQLDSITTNPAFTTPPTLPRETAAWTRQTKQLRAKVREYEDKLASLPSAAPEAEQLSSASIQRIAGMEEEVLGARERVLGLETRVQAFEGLPQDREKARGVVREKERELEGLKRRRDGLFEGLVGG
ncbi:hypothetical protein H2199_002179 [Coniosporium tulheliwenetii]|uniref:Uncharacterized protein n=1 Tax=Coniosporium tulheliwenetii TaxID=3383036 RepID=A0ACC2ZI46_9PEZI|nr:hypothetical protein H2199_002179 [Cladosporium sp. JES 115]